MRSSTRTGLHRPPVRSSSLFFPMVFRFASIASQRAKSSPNNAQHLPRSCLQARLSPCVPRAPHSTGEAVRFVSVPVLMFSSRVLLANIHTARLSLRQAACSHASCACVLVPSRPEQSRAAVLTEYLRFYHIINVQSMCRPISSCASASLRHTFLKANSGAPFWVLINNAAPVVRTLASEIPF